MAEEDKNNLLVRRNTKAINMDGDTTITRTDSGFTLEKFFSRIAGFFSGVDAISEVLPPNPVESQYDTGSGTLRHLLDYMHGSHTDKENVLKSISKLKAIGWNCSLIKLKEHIESGDAELSNLQSELEKAKKEKREFGCWRVMKRMETRKLEMRRNDEVYNAVCSAIKAIGDRKAFPEKTPITVQKTVTERMPATL